MGGGDDMDDDESSYVGGHYLRHHHHHHQSSSSAYPLDLTLKTSAKQVMMSMGGENANPKKLRKMTTADSSDNENELSTHQQSTPSSTTSSSSSSSAAVAAAAAVEQFRRAAQIQAAAAQMVAHRTSGLTSIDQLKLLSSPSSSSVMMTPTGSVNTPTTASAIGGGSKPLKCVLPPVSQEQFDKYSNINTDELVKRVKDLLSKYSISQRLFGECILGLSQGSVSDLLARPKHWVMLTQKGREPFIRMQMFIDDPDSIKRLMANQYKGGNGGNGGGSTGSSTASTPSNLTSSPVTPGDNKSLIMHSTTRAASTASINPSGMLHPSGLLQIDSKGKSLPLSSLYFFKICNASAYL